MATVFSLHDWDVLFVDGIILESLCPPRFSSYSREKNQQDPNVQRFPHLAGGRLNRVQCYQSRSSWITYKGLMFQCVKSTKCRLVTIFDMDKGEKNQVLPACFISQEGYPSYPRKWVCFGIMEMVFRDQIALWVLGYLCPKILDEQQMWLNWGLPMDRMFMSSSKFIC